jgi:hypothetical protein
MSHADSSDDTAQVTANLDKANGGLDTADEAPAFGAEDQLAAAQIESDDQANDSLANDPSTTSMDQASNGKGMRVIVIWGKVPGDPNATETRDWSGSFKISTGGLVVRRTIGFEPSTDKLLPRTSIDTVAFDSQTRPFVDGLALTVLEPDATATTPAPTLTYTANTGGVSYALDLSQLVSGPIVVDAGNGFKMIAVGHRRAAGACDSGFMHGRWHQLSTNVGDFLGVVTDDNGIPSGHVRGIWGQRKNGDEVVFGKFIDDAGKFRGLLTGTFANGKYTTQWIDRQGAHGTATGAYFAGSTANTGHFLGRWSEAACSDDPMPTPATN